ncbi:Protein CBG00498 [Caenorhabditis briggsae]|uniref:Protein CBG00498 n=1 Tax=Caenorhabditis briggsae TaxID=6238 RepID=A8WMT3_CAEBR|nr:Protein CBG00498 [Caenorhabditis briggsae]CAP21788.2 Protein CBG00498 [Caenorhabditis briggsae]
MPIWMPLSPPDSDGDMCDLRMEEDCFDFVYEIEQMSEARLPHVIHELRRPSAEKQQQQNNNGNDHKNLSNQLSNDIQKDKDSVYDAVAKMISIPSTDKLMAASPAYTDNSFSMDDTSQEPKVLDGSSAHLDQGTSSSGPVIPQQLHHQHHHHHHHQQAQQHQMPQPPKPKKSRTDKRAVSERKEKKKRKRLKMMIQENQNRTVENREVKRATTPPAAWREDAEYDGPEWNIVEDYALLQSVQAEFANAHKIERQPEMEGLLMNWELVASAVNKHTRFYRSARQCSIRYQMFVRPKEMGQLVASDPITKKVMKVDLSTLELSHLRRGRMSTFSQYAHDYGSMTDKKWSNRCKVVKQTAAKRQVQFWRGPRGLKPSESLSLLFTDIMSRNLQSLETGIPPAHIPKLQEFDVRPGVHLNAEEVITMSPEAIAAYEQSKKRLMMANRQPRPPPRQDYRFQSLVIRPYTVPIATDLEPTPPRREMVIAVPPLVPAAPIAQPPPAQSIHAAPQNSQQQQNAHQNAHQNPQGQGVQNQNPQPLPPIHHLQGSSGGLGGQLPPIGHLHMRQMHQEAGQQGQLVHSGSAHHIAGPAHHAGGGTIQRRTVSGTNMAYMNGAANGGNGPQGQSYVVMGSGQAGEATPTQQGGAQQQQPQHPQIQQQQQQQQQRVQYVPQGGGRGAYPTNTLVMQRGGRVVRPTGPMQAAAGGGGRMFIDNRHHQYPQNVVPVRVMPAGQQPQRMISGQRRPPAPGTVAAMVLPHRAGNGGVGQIRTMHLSRRGAYAGGPPGGPQGPNGGPQQQRINVMVQPQNMRGAPGAGGPQMGGVPAIRRQLVGRTMQRVDGNAPGAPQVAQVVVAPPQGMQNGPPVLHMQRVQYQQAPPPSQQAPPPQHYQGGPGGSGQGHQQGPSGGGGGAQPPPTQ